jgi:CHASE2 domain-containing sensor protein
VSITPPGTDVRLRHAQSRNQRSTMSQRSYSPEFQRHARIITIAGVALLGSFIALRLELPRAAIAVFAAVAVGLACATASRVLMSRLG